MGRFGTSWENSRVKSMLRQGLMHRSNKGPLLDRGAGASFVSFTHIRRPVIGANPSPAKLLMTE
jgi:hypothetical protein